MATTAPQTEPAAPRRRATRAVALDLAVIAGALALLAFPGLARLAAGRLPIEPRAAALAPLEAGGPGGMPRDLPAGRIGPVPSRPGDLLAAARALLGPRAGAPVIELVGEDDYRDWIVEKAVGGTLGFAPYPYRYPALERLLPDRLDARAATDLAARLMYLAAETEGHGIERYPNAAPVAFALLDRVREEGGCAAALDLLLLVAADDQPRDDVLPREAGRVARACPGDVTAGWVLGQFQSQRALLASTPLISHEGPKDEPAAVRRPFATFQALQRRFPRSAAAWSGEADACLRLAYQLPADQPFRARRLYTRALALYRRAARLAPGPEHDAGMARALAGLGRPAEAVAAQRRAIAAGPRTAAMLAPLVEYLESAHRFEEAARTAARLAQLPLEPAAPAPLYPFIRPKTTNHPLNEQDAAGPLSVGVGRIALLNVDLQPSPGGADASMQDYSFIPVFRPLKGVTGSHRWCADWSRRRDLILAGRPREALAGFPDDVTFKDLREPVQFSWCTPDPGPEVLAGIAQLELGDVAAARRGNNLNPTAYARQNLWRWAGDLPRAERAAREWRLQARTIPGPWIALGEIEFLRGHYNGAAADFGYAARMSRDLSWHAQEAESLLKRGASLVAAGRRDEGLDELRAADDIGSRAYALLPEGSYPDAYGELAWYAYFARAQAGDAQREAGDLRAAADSYAAARELEPRLRAVNAAFRGARVDNNLAVVAIALRRRAPAEAAANRAAATDPDNPALRMTQAFAAARAGHSDRAIALNRATLRADPTTYPAANDLGVLLARRGDDEAAVAALRRAVGANPRYALAWFNLGVVFAGMGPLRLVQSQGALARAFTLDGALRDRKRVLTMDERTYRTGLDLSKPLPPEWSFAGSQPTAAARTAGLVGILLLVLGLARRLAADGGAGRAAVEKWLEPVARLRWLRGPWPALLGVLATLLVFAWPLARSGTGGATAAVALLGGVLVLVGVVVRARAAAARRANADARGSAWPPGVVAGLGVTAAGFPWAPLPVVDSTAPNVHWAGPVALGALGLALTALTVWVDVPLTRAAAVAAMVMAASLLTPIKPLDGAAVSAAGKGGTALAGLGLALLLLLGLL